MTTDPYDMNNPAKWKMPDHVQEVTEEARATYYEAPSLPRCATCFNVHEWCTCTHLFERAAHPSAQPSSDIAVAGIHHADRERLLHEVAQRGIDQLEAFANGND